ncbi:MAG: hypothetical protein P0116_14420 [Candidatus Nitrosocosmicus sp.]|nr:hypothetical protein [Candidatus Nitrosocosmicus sp.]
MSIENFNLDDKSFDQLVEESRKKIPQVSTQWTNFNISDPGITLLELFAFLTDNQIYALNKITKNQYLKFLKLVGIIPNEASLPKVEVTLFSSGFSSETNTYTSCKKTFLPKGTRLASKMENLFLETDEDLCFISSLRVKRCITFSNDQIFENDLSNVISYDNGTASTVTSLHSPVRHNTNKTNKSILDESKKPFFYVFGPNAEENSRFYLSLEYEVTDADKNGDQKTRYTFILWHL